MEPIEIEIRHAVRDERALLEALQLRASLVWEDTRDALLAHPDAILLPEEWIDAGRVRVATVAGRLVGFSVVLPKAERVAELDGLFVEPDRMRAGVGRKLLQDAVAAGAYDRIDVIANLNALGFYRKVGFVEIGPVATRFGPAVQMSASAHDIRVSSR